MSISAPHAIINSHNKIGWYGIGQKRLERSLIYHGSTADHLFFDDWQTDIDRTCPYNIKIDAIETAISMGHERLLWLDCSVWAINNPMPIWDIIEHEGYYLCNLGYNCAQICNDRVLEYFKVTRDEAENMWGCISGIVGLNLSHPTGKEIAEQWIRAARDGMFYGDRNYNPNESSDPRFMFSRQDQSALSLIAAKMGLKMHDQGIHVSYYHPERDQSKLIFLMHGI